MAASVNVKNGATTAAYSAAQYVAAGAALTFTITSPASPTASFVDISSTVPFANVGTWPLGSGTSYSMTLPSSPCTVTVNVTSYSGAAYSGQQMLKMIFNVFAGQVPVTEFGAVGDGVADDSGAVQNALTALAGTGLSLFFPAGTYLCTTTTVVNGGVPCVFGAGASVTGTSANAVLNGGATPMYCRAVMTTFTGTGYTGSGTSTLTSTGNAAFGTHDGVATLAVGDVVLLQGGTLNSVVVTAKDTGPWVISAIGSAGAKWSLTRPSWWPTGGTIPQLAQLTIGSEGSLFGGTKWSSWAASGKLIGTDDPLFYPDKVATQVTLAASTVTLATVPFRSATATVIDCNLAAVGGTTTSTVGYGPIAALTAGYVGTGTVTIVAQAAGMTKNGTADTSVVSVLITNRAG